MSLRPDADDLHVAPPRVRADDAFLARLSAVSAASTARERGRAERHSGLRVACAAASVAAVVTGMTLTAGTLMGTDPAGGHHTPPAEQPHDRTSADVEDPAHAVEPTADPDADADTGKAPQRSPRSYDDGDGAADRDDDLPTGPRPAAPVHPENQVDRPDRPHPTPSHDDHATSPQDEPPADDDAARPPPESPAPAPAPDPNDPGTGNPGDPGDPGDDDHGDDPGDGGQGDDHGGDRAVSTADPGWTHGRGHHRGHFGSHGRHGGHHAGPRPAAPPRGA